MEDVESSYADEVLLSLKISCMFLPNMEGWQHAKSGYNA